MAIRVNLEEDAARAKKLAVIFPGIGYRTDKPLLYYAKELANEHGYAIREVHYRGFPEEADKKNARGRRELFEIAMEQTHQLLRSIPVEDDGELLFISKSIGTAVACAYAKTCDRNVRHVLYTPLEETPLDGVTDAIAFHGTADKYARTEVIEKAMKDHRIRLYTFQGANHSLETDDTLQDIVTLSHVMKRTGQFFSKDA
ncbi:MAG: alpha/beta hydrolase [Lachnospiraceae bacterium]|nr:alpha/beta hydrolase [Lachnospiraceae bacterium]